MPSSGFRMLASSRSVPRSRFSALNAEGDIFLSASGITPAAGSGALRRRPRAGCGEEDPHDPLILLVSFAPNELLCFELVEEIAGGRQVNRQLARELGNRETRRRADLGQGPELGAAHPAL